MDQESKRKIVHISMGFWTIALIFFPRWLAILVILAALFFVLVLARPSVWKGAFNTMASRENEMKAGLLKGPALYVLMVFISVIFLDLRVAATVFAMMAFGDGFANVIGTRFGRHRYPKFNNRSLEGFSAFIAFAFVSGVIVFFLVSMNPYPYPWLTIFSIKESFVEIQVVLVIFGVSIIAALTEMVSSGIFNDNISVPVVTGLLLTFLFAIL
jgi:phytol kinase